MPKIVPVGHIRDGVIESGANTYTESTINTNINPLSNQIILIHDIIFDIDPTTGLAGGADQLRVAVLKQTKSAMPKNSDADVIAKANVCMTVLTSGAGTLDFVITKHFDPPEPVAVDELILAIQGESAAAAMEVDVDIRYTPTTVTDGDFVKLRKA